MAGGLRRRRHVWSGLKSSKKFIEAVQKDNLKMQAQLQNLKPVDPAQEDEVVKKLDEILWQVHSDQEKRLQRMDHCVAEMARGYISIEEQLPKSPLFLKKVTDRELLERGGGGGRGGVERPGSISGRMGMRARAEL